MLVIENISCKYRLHVNLYQKLRTLKKITMQVSTNSFFTDNQKRLIVVLVLLVLSSVKMFGQTKSNEICLEKNDVAVITNAVAASDSDIDFMNWFMGSKQAQSASSTGNDASVNTKKQLINSGGATNRVLYKTLVKKVMSIDNAIV
jgi:hypothetical protein